VASGETPPCHHPTSTKGVGQSSGPAGFGPKSAVFPTQTPETRPQQRKKFFVQKLKDLFSWKLFFFFCFLFFFFLKKKKIKEIK